MTDDLMNERLRTAGESWQLAHTAAAVVDLPTDDPVRPASHRWLLAGLAAAAVVALAAGLAASVSRPTTHSSAGPAALQGTHWRLTRVDGSAPPPTARFTELEVSHGQLIFGDGCNTNQGVVTVARHDLAIGPIGGTLVLCTRSDTTRLSDRINRILTGSVQWSIDDGTLTLTHRGVGTLTYRLAEPNDPSALRHTTWQLTSVDTGKGAPSLVPGTERLTLAFDDRTRIGFSDGVNTSSGQVAFGRGALAIRQTATTQVGCVGTTPRCRQAELIDRVFVGTVTWSLEGSRLTITKDGVATLVYTRTANAPPAGAPSPTRTR